LLQFLPQQEFERSIKQFKSDRYVKYTPNPKELA